ncbi:molybdate transport system substrate-binding protein [Microbacterium endophyticum]|uniref:Molybdate transport system substrate-binding protein n=2 Tax=Microbacterium endophyticum TaxID=1526412 RepID=A0A7W4V4C3_9MICO|nr:molybdate ABC transporter substrate-binding protein [Microbacterium endophyticum]MBB2976575.1 molybdate transport system substrate-binding protein [Microbacterium endophyticum]NIK37542.1 molybdate transport system substrate-binding protein [Microbacterium endophyticum]
MRTTRALAALAGVTVTIVALAGCTSATTNATSSSAATDDELSGTLTIAAAASLGAAFDQIVVAFERQHPGVTISPITYDGSSTLATQIIEGAPIDVFASANEENMQKVVDAGLVTDPVDFATNTLVIVVPESNPAGIETLADLADPAVSVVLCAAEVPCGAASQTLLANAGLDVTPASSEQNVTAVLTKVEAGEADAGLVYTTDAVGLSNVLTITPDGAEDVVNTYPIAALSDSSNPDAAAAFVAFIASDEGQKIMADAGFGSP